MQRRFARYAWFVLVVNLAVIIWGAVVRATGSGAGCGEHWPLCNGVVVPPAPQLKTLIEYGHRLTSGVALLLVVYLAWWAFRAFPKGHIVRRTALFSLGFELSEGIIGAGLVLLGHVGANASTKRGYSLGLHLSNTLLLLAALVLTAWLATRQPISPVIAARRNWKPFLAVAVGGLLVIGISGAIAALGDTLFAANSLSEGMRQDFAANSHPFVRLRILHPILAVVTGLYVIGIAAYALAGKQCGEAARKLGFGLVSIIVLQMCLGTLNLLLLAPVPIQLAHLLLADLLWITFVLFSTELLRPHEQLSLPSYSGAAMNVVRN